MLRLALVVFAAAIPVQAAARSPAQLDCAVQRAPAGLGDNLAAAMIAMDRARLSPLQKQLEQVVRRCVVANRMRDAEAETYYDYVLARLPREALSRQLARAGIMTSRIDTVMGFGPGRTNMAVRDKDATEGARAAAEMAAAGIDEAHLSDANWDKVKTYLDLTPRMYRYLQALN